MQWRCKVFMTAPNDRTGSCHRLLRGCISERRKHQAIKRLLFDFLTVPAERGTYPQYPPFYTMSQLWRGFTSQAQPHHPMHVSCVFFDRAGRPTIREDRLTLWTGDRSTIHTGDWSIFILETRRKAAPHLWINVP
jgi:hypothetical protein